eukprot:CAMPEP_0180155196 /NCGR_PEP_ID=MMETSP0986-20121125/24657_1 /TAXON_ID=697907 /ORGANISM="non described non described, Strain CCMP2293" /LENGTH=79 /DNA_ID=CAMNT_0022103789 /DNA_START=463 /DNA_END=702 /DNA_ORIENTATION=+
MRSISVVVSVSEVGVQEEKVGNCAFLTPALGDALPMMPAIEYAEDAADSAEDVVECLNAKVQSEKTVGVWKVLGVEVLK